MFSCLYICDYTLLVSICHLQLYDSSAEVKLNEVIEVVGILSVDPSLAVFTSLSKYVIWLLNQQSRVYLV